VSGVVVALVVVVVLTVWVAIAFVRIFLSLAAWVVTLPFELLKR
jgi:hypothetical protein